MSVVAPSGLLLAYLAFIAIGLPDGVLGTAWPDLRDDFGWPQSGLGLILASVAAGYVLAANITGAILQRYRIGSLLAASTAMVALAAALMTAAPTGFLIIAAGLLIGLGSATIDTGLNAHAANHFSARHLNWLHAAYGVGAALGPVLMTLALTTTGSWRVGFAALGAGLLGLAILFALTRNRWLEPPVASTSGAPQAGIATTLDRSAVLQVIAFFLYTGIEAGAGQWSFTVLLEGRGVPLAWAGVGAATFWTALFVGRVLVGLVADRFAVDTLVRTGALGTLAGTVLFLAAPGVLGLAGLAVTGLALAPIFPMLMRRTADRFSPDVAARLFGLQVSAAMLGALAVPTLAGGLADLLGLGAVPWLLLAAAALQVLVVEMLHRGSRPPKPAPPAGQEHSKST